MLIAAVVAGAYHVPGAHQMYIEIVQRHLWFIVYWVGLGVLSSVGLGTGLHTFLLYLGPHIASVTLAASECGSLNFPEPPYPDEIVCPSEVDPAFVPSMLNIMAKVRYEAFLWGLGTALGELPPYFMARASRLSGQDSEDGDDLQRIEELKKLREQGGHVSLIDRGKIYMERLVERVGFIGILICASVRTFFISLQKCILRTTKDTDLTLKDQLFYSQIPNPLFDLAGITCGHFLVPFWKFFGATVLGKSVFKMHLQKIVVIIAFNEQLIEWAIDRLTVVPLVGRRLQEPFKTFLANQKANLHKNEKVKRPAPPSSLLSQVYDKIVFVMIGYFVVSIVNSLAQSWDKRIHKGVVHGKVHRRVARD